MRYQGSKSNIAKDIVNQIVALKNYEKIAVSLFCGACSVEILLSQVFEKIICNDANKYLIALLQGIKDGWEPPDTLSKPEYEYIKHNMDNDIVLTGFAGFGCSFSGKFFGGYASGEGRNYCGESKRALLRDSVYYKNNMEFVCSDYRDVLIPDNSIVYADPPYLKTTKYKGFELFDTSTFWRYMRELSMNHLVFISEESAPDDFASIWQKDLKRTMCKDIKGYKTAKEQLFVHKNNLK